VLKKPGSTSLTAELGLRGIGLVSALTIVLELIDIRRFGRARSLMAYMGLVSSEFSSGKTRRQGAITKTGNSRLRRVIVEAAWKYKIRPAIGKALKARQENQPPEVVNHSWKAQNRLHKKFWQVAGKKNHLGVAVVATARELVGFIWAVMSMPTPV
jgi:transposase